MEPMEIIGAAVLSIVLCVVGLLVGLWKDYYFKCKVYNLLFKKQGVFGIARIVSIRHKKETEGIINLTASSMIKYNGRVYEIDQKRIYLQGKSQNGFAIDEGSMSFKEGIAVITFDEESVMPLTYAQEENNVKSTELSTFTYNYIQTEIRLMMESMKNESIWMKVAAVVSIIVLFVAGAGAKFAMDSFSKINEIDARLSSGNYTAAMNVASAGMPGGTAQNGAITIKGPGVK